MTMENPIESAPTPAAPQKKRGGCLTALLVFMIVLNPLFGLYYFVAGESLSAALPQLPEIFLPILGLIGFANLAFGLAIWKWKKWGVYGFVASALITFVINAVYINPGSAFSGLIGVGLLLALVIPNWKQME